MYGLTEKHPSLRSPPSLEECLRNVGIAYRIQYPGRLSEDILRYAIRTDLGAAVGLRGPHRGDDKHIVPLVDFSDDSVKVIDPNDADGRTRQMSREHFRRWWDGFALVLVPVSDWVQRGALDDAGVRSVYGSYVPQSVRAAPVREWFIAPLPQGRGSTFLSALRREENGCLAIDQRRFRGQVAGFVERRKRFPQLR
jgi:hypothetical protein